MDAAIVGVSDKVLANVIMGAAVNEAVSAPSMSYDIVCLDKDGNEKWRESIKNLVTTAGKNDLIDKYFKGSAYTAAFYLGLKGTGTAVVGDTLPSHAGWSEVTPYTGNRPAITWGSTSSGANTATAVAYTIAGVSGTQTVAGAFISSVNTGTSGVLYSVADFSVARSVANGDTLNITPSVSIL